MTKKMLINATHPEENRVAIVEDGILTELDIEIAGKEQTKSNIYKASVVRIEPGLQAAFVDYGAERFGFLQMGEIHPSLFPKSENGGENRRPRISDVLRRGQEILVQVVKEERGTKGAALTTFLSLPGRYMVLMPESDTKGVSRKIEDESQRRKLKEAMASLDLPPHMGYIVRTAGIGQKKEELKRDFDYLVRVYRSIQEQGEKTRAPALIYKESNLAIRSLRDYFSSDMDEVLVDDPKVAEEAREFFQQVMPEYARLVKLHQERRPIFSRYQIEEQIDTISKNKVQLPSGGSIVIDPTEALVSIDVNSGKMAGEQGVESTAYKTNLEAAAEVARQLRLRDLGGLIVIDFIDMRDRKHIREIEKCLKDAMKYDKARVTVGRISQFGLLELSRQRIKAVLAEGSFLPCPHCDGSGKVKSAEAQAIAFLRKIHAIVAKGQIGRVEGEVPLEVATYLLNLKREELFDMERRHQMVLVIKGHPDFVPGHSTITVSKRERDDQIPDQPERSLAPIPDFIPAPVNPEEETEEVDTEEEAVEEQSAPGEEGKKKRKRRRRKKKTEEPEEQTDAAEKETPVSEEATFASAESAEAEGIEEEEETETGELSETAGEEKRKRRRRRRRKKPAAALEESAAVSPETPSESVEGGVAEAARETPPSPAEAVETETAPADALPEESLSAPPEETPKPARKRRRPARRKEEEPETPAEGVREGAAETQESTARQEPAEAETPQEQPAPETAVEARKSAAQQEQTEAEKPREPAAEPQEGVAPREAAIEPPSPPQPEEPEGEAKKPAPARKKRAPRKKAEPEMKTETGEQEKAVDTAPPAEEEPKPKKRAARPRRQAAPKKEKAETSATSAEPDTESPPPKRRRAPRKKVSETEKTETE